MCVRLVFVTFKIRLNAQQRAQYVKNREREWVRKSSSQRFGLHIYKKIQLLNSTTVAATGYVYFVILFLVAVFLFCLLLFLLVVWGGGGAWAGI